MSINKRLSIVLITVLISTSTIIAQNPLEPDSTTVAIENILNQNDELLKLNMSKTLSEDEKDIQVLVYTMQNSWADLTKSKKSNEIIAYFQKEFIVNYIEVDTENRGQVSRYTKDSFKDFLEKLIDYNEKNNATYKFGSIVFLDIEIKDNIYFNVIYKSMINKYKNEDKVATRTSFITITGKKIETNWKIANYSWVSFESIP